MFYFKDSEYPNIETKTGPTGSLIKYVEKHSCYKAAEKLLLALAEKNKECAVKIFPPKLKKKSFVDFYFEEIELSEEEINAFKLLGKDKNALLEKTPVIIQLHFRFKSDDCKEDALDFIIRKYRYIGYNAERWIKQKKQSEFILTYKSPEKIFFKCNNMKKSFPASITSLYIMCNLNNDNERKYARLFVISMLEHLSEITGSKIYIDLIQSKSGFVFLIQKSKTLRSGKTNYARNLRNSSYEKMVLFKMLSDLQTHFNIFMLFFYAFLFFFCL